MRDQRNNLVSEKSLAISTPNVGVWCARRDSNPHDFTHCHLKAARLPIPPRALFQDRRGICTPPETGPSPDQRRRCNKSGMEGQDLPVWRLLPCARRFRQHLLDFDRDTVAVDQHYATGDRQVVGEDLDLVRLGGVEFDDGAAAQAHYLMDGHRGGPEDYHEVDADFIEGWHWGSDPYRRTRNCVVGDHHVMVSQWLM